MGGPLSTHPVAAGYGEDVTDRIRVAVVGYGLGGSVFHAPVISATEGLHLVAIVTSDPARRQAALSRYPGVDIPASLDELLAGRSGPDLVVVSVPNAGHVAVAGAIVRAGLSVVVDKPVAPTAAEVAGLAGLAAERGVSVVPFHNRRWDGDFLTLASLVSGGRLGEVWRFESRFERWRPGPPATGTWKSDPAQAGAGILYDLGTHIVDQAVALFGRPERVYAEAERRGGTVDDDSFIALHYRTGPVVHLWASSRAADSGPRFRVLGSEAGYVKFGMDPQEDQLRAGWSPADLGFGEEDPQRWGRLGVPGGTEAVPTRPGAYRDFYAGMAAHLGQGAPAPVDVADAVTGLEVIEAAHRSVVTGSAVTLG